MNQHIEGAGGASSRPRLAGGLPDIREAARHLGSEWVREEGRVVRNPHVPWEEGMRRTITAVTSQGLLLAGVLGRAAVYKKLLGDPLYEINARGETPLLSIGVRGRSPRDVDVLGGRYEGEVNDDNPHIPDPGVGLMIERTKSGGWAFIKDTRERVPLDPFILAPVEGETIYGLPCVTVRPATHMALLMHPNLREKDILARELLGEVLPQEEKDLLQSRAYQEFTSLLSEYYS